MFYQRNEKVYWLFLFVLEENWLKALSSRTFEFAVHRLTFHTMLCIRLSADPIDYEANLIWFVGNWKCMQEPFISWITKSTQANWNWNWNWKKKMVLTGLHFKWQKLPLFILVHSLCIHCHVIVRCKYIDLSDINFAYRGETMVCMGSACLSKMSLHAIDFKRGCLTQHYGCGTPAVHHVGCITSLCSESNLILQ